MKRNFIRRVTAWLAALAMIASPAGVNIAEVAVMAADDVSSVVETTDSTSDSEENAESGTSSAENGTAQETESAETESIVTVVPEELDSEETSVPETEASESDVSETEVSESEAFAEETVEPEIYHYVSPNRGGDLIPYEYYAIDYGDEEVPDENISYVSTRSYYSSMSDYSSTDGYNALTSDEKAVYNSMYSALAAIDESSAYDATYISTSTSNYYRFDGFKIASYAVDKDTLFKVFVAVSRDNPQFFWLGHSYAFSSSTNETIFYFILDDGASDYADGSERMAVKTQLMNEIKTVLEGAEEYGNEYTKEWYIHNYLCDKTVYDTNGSHAHDISGLLIDGEAVCESYAKCFQLFMNALDIDVLYVTGIGNGGGHAWNQVGLDNDGTIEWYNIDVTWDDNTSSYGCNYNYFNAVDSDGSYYDFTNGYNGYNEHTPLSAGDSEYLYGVNKCNSTTFSYSNHDQNYQTADGLTAKIGNKKYGSLDAAISAVNASGQTITLLNNAEYNGAAMPSYNFTIDGAGYTIDFNDDMTLKGNLTLKNITGITVDEMYEITSDITSLPEIITGSYTLNAGEGMAYILPVILNGSSNAGTVNFAAGSSEGYGFADAADFKTVNVADGAYVQCHNGVSGTNLKLGEDSIIAVDYYGVHFANYYAQDSSLIGITSDASNAYVSFSGTIYASYVNLTAANIAEGTCIIITGKNYSVDKFTIMSFEEEPYVYAVKKVFYEGEYRYSPEASADYTISSGTQKVYRTSLEEAVDYIDEAAKTSSSYTITYTGENDSVNISGADLETSKAKEIIIEGTAVCVTDDITLKTNLTFRDGAEFYGNITTGSYVLKLTDSTDYKICGGISSASNITVDGADLLLFDSAAEQYSVKFNLNNVILKNGAGLSASNSSVSITKLTMLDASVFSAAENSDVTVNSVISTGGGTIETYSSASISLTGTVTLTDGTPVTLSCENNVAENGQTAMTVTNSNVKATSFTTSNKTENGTSLSIIRVGNELKYASAVFSIDGLGNYVLWEDALAAINTAGSAAEDFTVILLDDVTVDNLVLPSASKANNVTFSGDYTLTLGNKTLTVPVNTSFGCKVSAENLNITVAAGKTFTVNKDLTINSITGTATSNLVVIGGCKLTAASVTKFCFVSAFTPNDSFEITQKMSDVANFEGKLYVSSADAAVTISNISYDSAIYPTAEEGTLPKITVNSIADGVKLTLNVNNGESLASGTAVLYSAADISDSVIIENKTSTAKVLSAFYYKASKQIKVEYAGAVTLSDGIEETYYPTVERALEYVTDKNADYTVTLNEDLTVEKLVLPAASKAKSITFNGEGTLILTQAALAIPVNTTFECKVEAPDTNVTVAANVTFTSSYADGEKIDNNAASQFNNVTGTSTSVLNGMLVVNGSLKTFKKVNAAIAVMGDVSGIGEFCGDTLYIMSVDSNAAVNAVYAGTLVSLLTDDNGNFAKFTVNDVISNGDETTFSIVISTSEDGVIKLPSGTTVLYSSKDISDKVTVTNVTSAGDKLTPFYYSKTKEIKAEYAGAVTLSDGTSNYAVPNLELAFDKITQLKNSSADYTITVNSDLNESKFAVPVSANSIKLVGSGSDRVIKLNGVTSVAAAANLEFENIALESSKPFTLTANKNLSLTGFASESMTALKGNAKYALDWGAGNNIYADISAFGTVTIKENAGMVTGKTVNLVKLVMEHNSSIAVSGTSKVTVKDIEGAEGAVVLYGAEFVPISVTGNASGTIKFGYAGLNDFSDGQLLLTAKTASLTAFAIESECCPDDGLEYTLSRTGDKVYMRSVKLLLSDGTSVYKMAAWDDAVSSINAINDKNADYVISLAGDYDIGAAMTMPKAKTYKSLEFTSDGNYCLSFVGTNITLTGNTSFRNMELSAVKKSGTDYIPAAYNISAGANDLIIDSVTVGKLTNITSTGNVLLSNCSVEGNVSAKNLSLTNTDVRGNVNVVSNFTAETDTAVYGTLTADEINSANSKTAPLTLAAGKKFTIGKTGFTNSDTLYVKYVNADGTSSEIPEGGEIAAVTGGYYGNIVIVGQEDMSVVRSGSKLVAGATDKMYRLYAGSADNTDFENADYELYASIKDVMTEITRRNDSAADYTVVIANSETITGTLPLPTAKKYNAVYFVGQNPSVTLSMTGDITLTGNLFFDDLTVKKINAKTGEEIPLNINVGTYMFAASATGEIGNVNGAKGTAIFYGSTNVSGNINVGDLGIASEMILGSKSALTANEIWQSKDDTVPVLVYPYANAAKIKAGIVRGQIAVRLMDGDSVYAYPTDKTFDIMNITGDYIRDEVIIDGYDNLSVVRSGSKLVAGATDNMKYRLYFSEGDSVDAENDYCELYLSLNDIVTEINRVNSGTMKYTVLIADDEEITGAFPLPAAKKYDSIYFLSITGQKAVTVTSDLTLTGNVYFCDGVVLKKVNTKTGEEMPLNINVGTYEFSADDIGAVGNINGAKGTAIFYGSTNVSGNINVGDLGIASEMILGSKSALTANEIWQSKDDTVPVLAYPYANAAKIKINSADNSIKINLLDADGNSVVLTEADAGKVLMAQYTGNINNIAFVNSIPEGYVLTKTDKNALTIGKAVAETNGVKYASLNEAIASADYRENVILLEDIAMTTALIVPENVNAVVTGEGKTLTLKGVSQINGTVTFDGISIKDSTSKFGTSYKFGAVGQLNFYNMNIDIYQITAVNLSLNGGMIEFSNTDAVINGTVFGKAIIDVNKNSSLFIKNTFTARLLRSDSTDSCIKILKGKNVTLDCDLISSNVKLADADGSPVTIKTGDNLYKSTIVLDDEAIRTVSLNTDADGNTHSLTYSKGYVKYGGVK